MLFIDNKDSVFCYHPRQRRRDRVCADLGGGGGLERKFNCDILHFCFYCCCDLGGISI